MSELPRLSEAQRRALADIDKGRVFYKWYFGRIYGMRSDTLDALERRGLVEILRDPMNPEARAMSQRCLVVLTEAGRRALDAR